MCFPAEALLALRCCLLIPANACNAWHILQAAQETSVSADALCDPVDTKQTFVEELVRLPKCFLCYTPAAGTTL